jgi:hypothetical protein
VSGRVAAGGVRPPDRRGIHAYAGPVRRSSEEVTLSQEHAHPGVDDAADGGEDAVLRFVGGPLDGRVEVRDARHGAPLPTITHVHLHGGPKVVHRYDLRSLTDGTWVYHVRPAAQRVVDGRPVAD